ncbi:MAG: hypothetical protein JJE39_07675 [Vicinamibacteria bacterium]|nr:hypothetical protein [Vicinamibacteria bacterium]
MSPVTVLRAVHISAGTVALLTFLIPMMLPKGGRGHRRAGWVFVAAMMTLCASAGPLSIYRLATETSRAALVTAAFLFYITIMSFSSVWAGLRILRFKGTGRHAHPLDLGVAGLLAVSGVATMVMGAAHGAAVLEVFGLLGVVIGVRDFQQWLNPNKERMHWWFRHMGGMIGASIAALTAFSVLNAPRFGFRGFSLVAWVLPGALFLPVAIAWNRYYRRKFGMDVPSEPGAEVTPGVPYDPRGARHFSPPRRSAGRTVARHV